MQQRIIMNTYIILAALLLPFVTSAMQLPDTPNSNIPGFILNTQVDFDQDSQASTINNSDSDSDNESEASTVPGDGDFDAEAMEVLEDFVTNGQGTKG